MGHLEYKGADGNSVKLVGTVTSIEQVLIGNERSGIVRIRMRHRLIKHMSVPAVFNSAFITAEAFCVDNIMRFDELRVGERIVVDGQLEKTYMDDALETVIVPKRIYSAIERGEVKKFQWYNNE